MNNFVETKQCRSCGKAAITPVLDLGEQRIANGFHDGTGGQPSAPLLLARCTECGLVQLGHSVDMDSMYRTYWYRSGMNQTMRTHLAKISNLILGKVKIKPGDVVMDIGCNDGTLLALFPRHACKIGVDPCRNISPSVGPPIPPGDFTFVNEYFTFDNVKDVLGGRKAKVVSSIAMFYDLNDPKSFVGDIAKILHDDGIWVLELSYLPRMIQNAAYDSICHEHVAYYSMGTFLKVLEGSGLAVMDASINDMNGGSFRMLVSKCPYNGPYNDATWPFHKHEGEMDLCVPPTRSRPSDNAYDDFIKRVATSKQKLVSFFAENKKKTYGYGASTKGQVVLQYCGLTNRDMVAIADRNQDKHGLFTPGTDIRICSEDEMRKDGPELLLVFPWYFMDEFVTREKELYKAGCRFILPLPEFKVA